MKIRTEFVTNSSSTSFGASLGDALLGMLLGLGAIGMKCGGPGASTVPVGPDLGADSAIDGAIQASQQASAQAAQAVADADAAQNQMINNILGDEGAKLDATASKLDNEIAAYTKQWADAKQGVDPKDPGLDAMNKQYQDYIDYLKGQRSDIDVQKYELQTAVAQQAAANDAKTQWIKDRQEDMVQTLEQKSFLEAVAKGYGSHEGYDITKVNQQLAALNERQNQLQKTLEENNATINYTPRDRGEIGPSADILRLQDEQRKKADILQNEINAAKLQRNLDRAKELEKERAWQEKVYQNEMGKASFWNGMTQGAETIQKIADVGVEGLSNVTGPAGKYVKAAYKFGKGVGEGFGKGIAEGNMGSNLTKGALKGALDVGKDVIKDGYGQKAQNIYIAVTEPGKAVINSVIDGKTSSSDLANAATQGALKGTSEVLINSAADKLPTIPMPKGLDHSGTNVSTALGSLGRDVKGILNGVNPATPNTFAQAGAKGLFKGITDTAKTYMKGDPTVLGETFSNGPSYPKQFISGAGKMAGSAVKSITGH